MFLLNQSVLLCTKNLKIKGDSNTSLRQKLLPRFIGPYTIIQTVGKAAMKLKLPSGPKIHPVFHVSMLRPYVLPVRDPNSDTTDIPMPLDWLEGDPEFFIDHIVSHRVFKVGKKFVVHYLIRWHGFDANHDSFEPRGTVPPGLHNLFDDYDAENDLTVTSTGKLPKTLPVLKPYAPVSVPLPVRLPLPVREVQGVSRPVSKRIRFANSKYA